MNINDLVEGEKAEIVSCEDYRLMENGFIKETPIQIYKKINGVVAIYLRGTIIACRDSDLDGIYVVKKEK